MINMGDVAEWHRTVNGGCVPFLEGPDGDVVSDANGTIQMELASNLAPGRGYNLWPHDTEPANLEATKKTA